MSQPNAEPTLPQLLDELEKAQNARDPSRSVNLCRALVARLDRNAIPELWAALQGTLADCLRQDSRGDPDARADEAITAYLKALEVFTATTQPAQWAANHGNLGNLYMDRRRGTRAQNLSRAIHHYEQALTVYRRDQTPVDWAATHQSLGDARREASPQAPETAIRHYEAALGVWTPVEHPRAWSQVQLRLADTYATLAARGRADAAEKELFHLDKALLTFPKQDADALGMIHEKAAHLYMKRESGPRADNQEKAIEHFEAALQAYTAARRAKGCERARGNLGHLYAHRERGRRADNVKTAIKHLEALLAEGKPEGNVRAQVNAALGILYSDPSIE